MLSIKNQHKLKLYVGITFKLPSNTHSTVIQHLFDFIELRNPSRRDEYSPGTHPPLTSHTETYLTTLVSLSNHTYITSRHVRTTLSVSFSRTTV